MTEVKPEAEKPAQAKIEDVFEPLRENFENTWKMYESGLSKALTMQQKMLKGIEVFANIDTKEVNSTPKDVACQIDKAVLYHYRPLVKNPLSIPVMIVYALMNKQYIMDIQQDKSFVRKLLELGLDVYIVDWGYPTPEDKYLTLEEHIEDYYGGFVDYIRAKHNVPAINVIGKCQGGTFSCTYASLHPEKIKNLVTIASPFDFSVTDGLLFKWSKYLNYDLLVDAYGNVPGDFMNEVFIMLSPYNLAIGKYINLIDSFDDPKALGEFLRMEKWIFDCPDQAGETYKKWMKDLWVDNKLMKGEFELGGKKVDLKKITCPVLNVYGSKDNLIPNSASKPLLDLVGSKDKEEACFNVGHAGIVASTTSQKEIAPKIATWIKDHCKK